MVRVVRILDVFRLLFLMLCDDVVVCCDVMWGYIEHLSFTVQSYTNNQRNTQQNVTINQINHRNTEQNSLLNRTPSTILQTNINIHLNHTRRHQFILQITIQRSIIICQYKITIATCRKLRCYICSIAIGTEYFVGHCLGCVGVCQSFLYCVVLLLE